MVPSGEVQFFLESGEPNAAGKVYMYVAGTDLLAATWQDSQLTINNPNPIVLDAGGRATIWGLGNYTQVVEDASGNQIWSQDVTANITFLQVNDTGTVNAMVATIPGLVTAGLASPLGQLAGVQLFLIPAHTNTGATNATINGIVVPVQYSNGNALVGGELYAGALIPAVYNATKGVVQLLGIQQGNTGVIAGEIRALAGPNVPAGWALCYGQAVLRSTYPNTFGQIGTAWGAGDGATTFNLPDLRGRGLFGADGMGGTAASRLTYNSLGGANTATANASVGIASGATTGSVTGFNITFGGSGYTSAPAITISGGGGSGATATATITNGVVTAIAVTAGGAGYVSAPTVTIASPNTATATVGVTGGSELMQNHIHSTSIIDEGHYHSEVTYGAGGSALTIGGIQTGSTNGYFSTAGDAPGGTLVTTNPAETGISVVVAPYGNGNAQNLPPAGVVNWIIAMS